MKQNKIFQLKQNLKLINKKKLRQYKKQNKKFLKQKLNKQIRRVCCYQFIFLISTLKAQCNLLNKNIYLTHLNSQFNCHFLNIEEKIQNQLVIQMEKMKKKQQIKRNQQIIKANVENKK
ncbi:hypothetical protein TTHERM_002653453 (macronuclear) [Tetrahymena thermophila SB210]|uniref:Uncharacterized protein n=1 Tax=Tetrahymena thermophila (strain SB210) TaxID=312017 RepID=W7X6E9_TETTS|nr:hypothetical protein TTHERM_002653453 [Tetrahymena thermophila SB210]EWS72987.1 hypothetical protein TTHERM_002653453 [Tetrahymena thermophila SB210]|eukprot:XP_012654478.1 hypothetical protein TTHERM_002653453 [Tetrahymena thermophila SB210]